MCLPAIFRWPTPWLWCSILGLVAVATDSFGEALSGIAVVFIVASAVYYFGGRGRERAPERPIGAGLDERLAEIERGLTDTQDVMIALSEKVDRWEDELRGRGAAEAAAGETSR